MNIVAQLLYLYTLAIFARAILSFFPMRPGSPIAPVAQFLYRITEPVLAPVRRVLPSMGGLDLSPLVVILGIQILTGILL
ncbi:MAG: YggT family protein [Actinobacteria bacterium]|nr:YggT family protein [Actinomycetota bacterium]